jgi:hypothetical protein
LEQRVPQAPQLFWLVWRFAQLPLQSVCPAAQPVPPLHWLFWHVPPVPQSAFTTHSTQRSLVVLHTGRPVFAQVVSLVHCTHACVVVLQTWAPWTFWQFASPRHCTHTLAAVSQ